MVRKGRFAIVDGKEYRLYSRNRQYYLKSKDILDLANGFTVSPGEKDTYVKKVCVDELEDAYEAFPYVMLEGYRFSVESTMPKTGVVVLVTSNPFVQGKIQVKPYGTDEFMIELPIEDLTIEEDRIAILGFEHNHSLPYRKIKNVE